jgi:hypothetical protein
MRLDSVYSTKIADILGGISSTPERGQYALTANPTREKSFKRYKSVFYADFDEKEKTVEER